MRSGFVVVLFSVVPLACEGAPTLAEGTDYAPRAAEPAALIARTHTFAQLRALARTAGGPDVTTRTNSVYVEAVQEQSQPKESWNMGAQFGSYASEPVLGTADGCTLYDASKTTGVEVSGSAGALTLTLPNETVVLDPSGTTPNVAYDQPTGTLTEPFGHGEFSVSAAGGPDLGAFSGSVELAKAIAGFTYPSSLSRAAGYDVSWTGDGAHSAFEVVIAASSPADGALADLVCVTKDTGSFTVSSAALSLFPAKYTSANVILFRYHDSYELVRRVTVTIDAEQVLYQDEPATLGP